MGKIISILFCVVLLFSCKKDKVFTCEGVQMTGDRSVFVGKWRWYKTIVEQWYDIGPSNWIDYKPQNQGFDYYFTISSNGEYKGFRNDSLIESFLLNEVELENFTSTNPQDWYGINAYINCTSKTMDFSLLNHFSSDTITISEYPFDFDDEVNHLRSYSNYFARE